jgi:hypothetical protein
MFEKSPWLEKNGSDIKSLLCIIKKGSCLERKRFMVKKSARLQ